MTSIGLLMNTEIKDLTSRVMRPIVTLGILFFLRIFEIHISPFCFSSLKVFSVWRYLWNNREVQRAKSTFLFCVYLSCWPPPFAAAVTAERQRLRRFHKLIPWLEVQIEGQKGQRGNGEGRLRFPNLCGVLFRSTMIRGQRGNECGNKRETVGREPIGRSGFQGEGGDSARGCLEECGSLQCYGLIFGGEVRTAGWIGQELSGLFLIEREALIYFQSGCLHQSNCTS